MEKLIKLNDWCIENGIDFVKILKRSCYFIIYDFSIVFNKVKKNQKNSIWLKEYSSDSFLNDLVGNSYISDETPSKIYGIWDCDTLKAELKKWCHLYLKDKNSDIYSKIDDIRDFNNDEIGNISRKLAPIFNVDYSTIYTALTKAKEKFIFEVPITYGVTFDRKWKRDSYEFSNFKIVFYINNIKKLSEPTLERKVEMTFAMASLDCLFYRTFEEYAFRGDYATKVVKDSIIRYLDFEYMSKHYSDFAKANYLSSLAKHSVAIFPPSGVRYINSIDQCAELLSVRVNQALFDLIYKVDKETYYDILNHDIKTNYNNSVKPVIIKSVRNNNLIKTSLIYQIVNSYCKKNPNISLDDLKKAFPDNLIKTGCIIKEFKPQMISDIELRNEFFVDKIIRLDNVNDEVIVRSCFTKEEIEQLIKHANDLGINVSYNQN